MEESRRTFLPRPKNKEILKVPEVVEILARYTDSLAKDYNIGRKNIKERVQTIQSALKLHLQTLAEVTTVVATIEGLLAKSKQSGELLYVFSNNNGNKQKNYQITKDQDKKLKEYLLSYS